MPRPSDLLEGVMVQFVRGEAAMDVPGREHLWLESLRKELKVFEIRCADLALQQRTRFKAVIPESPEVFKVVVFKTTSRLQDTETVQSICAHRLTGALSQGIASRI